MVGRTHLLIPFFRKIKTDQRDVEQLQSNCAQQFTAIKDCPFLSGAAVSASLVTGSNKVDNPLQRTIQGWIITDRDSAATVYKSTSDNFTVTLVASAPINLQIWLY